MEVKCALCDTINTLEDESLQAKRIRNLRVSMYLCPECHDRIDNKTRERHATGHFHMYNIHQKRKKHAN